MLALLQRIARADVQIDGAIVAQAARGLLVFVGVQPGDTEERALQLLDRILKYRVFSDDRGRMNLNLQQIGGDLLLVPQFTLAADTRHGLRPGFSTAAAPEVARVLFAAVAAAARAAHARVSCGVFGADMQVSLVNDGPVTFWLEG